MSRLPFLRREEADESGTVLFDQLTSSRGTQLINDQGGLMGPFNAWVHASELGSKLVDLGGTLRFGTSVDRRLLEVAIITVGAHWKAEFEWWAHSRMAREHGVPDTVIDAIRLGDPPDFVADDERIVHDVARQLAAEGGINPTTYGEAQSLLGDRGVVEIVTLCGYYTLVCFTLNAFEVPLPPGEAPIWARPE